MSDVQNALRIMLPQLSDPIFLDVLSLKSGYNSAQVEAALELMMEKGEVELHLESGVTRVEWLGEASVTQSSLSLDAVTLERLFAEGLKVSQVCERIGVSVPAYYKRIENRDDLESVNGGTGNA